MRAVIVGSGGVRRVYYQAVVKWMNLDLGTVRSGEMYPGVYLYYPPESYAAVQRICKEASSLNQFPQVYYQRDGLVWNVVVLFRIKPLAKEFLREITDPDLWVKLESEIGADIELVMIAEADFPDEHVQKFLSLYSLFGYINLVLLDQEQKPAWRAYLKSFKLGLPASLP